MKNKLFILLLLVGALNAQIKIKPVDMYGLKKIGRNTYELKLKEKAQTLIRLTGILEDKGYQKVLWKTDKKFFWTNGFATDFFNVVNPYTYSKPQGNGGVVNTMFGPLPEMRGQTIVITATYDKPWSHSKHSDKIYIKLR
jgi:hypothetical protein|tara:strand:+ start:15189 stop:15608 length:420 start_codon:yes stop_codon:yes gene_type:complete